MGNFLLLNFGTYCETNRFKALAKTKNFLTQDRMDAQPLGELLKNGGMRSVRQRCGTDTYSFYELQAKVWRSKLSDGQVFSKAFKTWFEGVLKEAVHCVYISGHHWDDHDSHRYLYLSWGEDTSHFHARIDTKTQLLHFGVSGKLIEIDAKSSLGACELVLGFGCNTATSINSRKYQTFFSQNSTKAIILGWERSIGVPKKELQSVNKRFFDYLESYVKSDASVPGKNRLHWFYQNKPMELIRAWGHATIFWFTKQARARDEKGTFYKFKVDKEKKSAQPVKA